MPESDRTLQSDIQFLPYNMTPAEDRYPCVDDPSPVCTAGFCFSPSSRRAPSKSSQPKNLNRNHTLFAAATLWLRFWRDDQGYSCENYAVNATGGKSLLQDRPIPMYLIAGCEQARRVKSLKNDWSAAETWEASSPASAAAEPRPVAPFPATRRAEVQAWSASGGAAQRHCLRVQSSGL